ncbi:succinate dehydrogenase hydrophobic anchor subunit [Paraburkholderia bannensis]|uniref:Succinate dehydrogenase hydrophobic anchor subunit n=1 Tax=Paraburkholderia bannensis TaxID=765414 RepID=A0A7W9U3V9_9BURK|nr:hypothetical protein [Paraburkholderia bannensis]MBB6106464.1 succinate dehydrogenase hydrophobic anchor subunit [Paraburkholderia bannensis]
MPDLKKRHPSLGSASFALATAAIVFCLVFFTRAAPPGARGLWHIVCLSLACGLASELLRLVWLHSLRRGIAAADDRIVMKVSVNGVEVGAIPEPVYARMRMESANDPRNYLAQAFTVVGALSRHALLAFGVTMFVIAAYFLECFLMFPQESTRELVTIFAQPAARFDHIATLAGLLHAIAGIIASLYGIAFFLIAGTRLLFCPPESLLSAFHNDLLRRVRLTVGTPVSGPISVFRARRA